MADEIAVAPIEGVVIDNVVTRLAWPDREVQAAGPQARLGIGGPINGKVIVSSSARLDYRKPVMTITEDIFSGQRDAVIDAEPIVTYLPETVFIAGEREYRIWIPEIVWHEADMEDIVAQVTLVLIDSRPALTEPCYR